MKFIKNESLLTHPFASMSIKLFQDEKGNKHKHLLLEKKDAVCLTLYDTHLEKLLFVKQFRAGAFYNPNVESSETIEPIAGHIDDGEMLLTAVCRETKEETGIDIEPADVIFIAKGLTSPGISNEMHYHYFSKFDSSKIDMTKVMNSIHGIDGESIQIVMYSIKEAMEMVTNCKIVSSHAIIGVMFAALNVGQH